MDIFALRDGSGYKRQGYTWIERIDTEGNKDEKQTAFVFSATNHH